MSFFVALQSAVFYFMACTPCSQARHRHQAKQQAKRERADKEMREAAMEERELAGGYRAYRHPSPFNTNPFWAEEIRMGPSLPKNGKNGSQRRLTSSGGGGATAAAAAAAAGDKAGNCGGGAGASVGVESNVSSSVAVGSSSPTVAASGVGGATSVVDTDADERNGAVDGDNAVQEQVPEQKQEDSSQKLQEDEAAEPSQQLPQQPPTHPELPRRPSSSSFLSEDWNHKRYQREDEELWGWGPSSEPSIVGSVVQHESLLSRTAGAHHKLMDALARAGSSAGRLIEAKLGDIGVSVKDHQQPQQHAGPESSLDKAAGAATTTTAPTASTATIPSTPGSAPPRQLTDADRRAFYFSVRNPPVNDYHPPVVSSRPTHRLAHRWMLQPPPPARVMEGNVPVRRTASQGSGASREGGSSLHRSRVLGVAGQVAATGASSPALLGAGAGIQPSLGRFVQDKLIQSANKLRRDGGGGGIGGDGKLMDAAPLELVPSSSAAAKTLVGAAAASKRSAGTRSDRARMRGAAATTTAPPAAHQQQQQTLDEDDEDALGPARATAALGRGRRKARAQPPGMADEDEDEDEDQDQHGKEERRRLQVAVAKREGPEKTQEKPLPTHAAHRPLLETIVSSDADSQPQLQQ